MGWTACRDTVSQLSLRFRTAEEAVGFARKNGWKYEVQESYEESTWKAKSYASNFKYSPGPLPYIPTK